MHRLVAYVAHHADVELVGKLATHDMRDAEIDLYPDADLAGGRQGEESSNWTLGPKVLLKYKSGPNEPLGL